MMADLQLPQMHVDELLARSYQPPQFGKKNQQ